MTARAILSCEPAASDYVGRGSGVLGLRSPNVRRDDVASWTSHFHNITSVQPRCHDSAPGRQSVTAIRSPSMSAGVGGSPKVGLRAPSRLTRHDPYKVDNPRTLTIAIGDKSD
jgi:hypothetical protein